MIAGGGTGGHLYPALNLAEALRRRAGDDVEVLLVGAERGIEAEVLPEREFSHRLLPFEPIYRSRPWRNWRLGLSGIRLVGALRRLFRSFDPELVVGTGGYVAGPVLLWAKLERRRTAIQEQNSYPGVTTRLLARWVDEVHLGYREALDRLRPGRTTRVRVHGNPIRWPETPPDPAAARRRFGLGSGRVVLVSGGSQGAVTINDALVRALHDARAGDLPALPDDVEILWSTGRVHFAGVREALAGAAPEASVTVVPYIDRMEEALALCCLAVSRAGALALAELCAWGVPALLVPYPHAAADHQAANARVLERVGAALVFPDASVRSSPSELWRALIDTLSEESRLEAMAEVARGQGRPRAADRIAEDLRALASRP